MCTEDTRLQRIVGRVKFVPFNHVTDTLVVSQQNCSTERLFPERQQNVFQKGKADSPFPGNLIVTAIVVRELKNEGGSD